jgi:putative CocE/NonD family hydrolase
MARHAHMRALGVSLCLLIGVNSLAGQCPASPEFHRPVHRPTEATPSASRYERQTFFIPMRDGVKLHTIVLRPIDLHQRLPFLLTRSPYGIEEPTEYFTGDLLKAGYLFVVQDVRGRFGSEGTFRQMTPHLEVKRGKEDTDESTDTYDTIDWLLRNVRPNNGNAGLMGVSYGGFYAASGMIDAHPALKAVSPQAPQTDWFVGDDLHRNGALMLATSISLMESMALGRKALPPIANGLRFDETDAYQFYLALGPLKNADLDLLHGQVPNWNEITEHGTYDDFWRSRDILPHVRSIRPAVLIVGGWYDAFDLYGTLHLLDAMTRQSAATPSTFVMGPWVHGQWSGEDDGSRIAELKFGSNTARYFRRDIEMPFFETYLKGNRLPPISGVIAFETGANRWHRLKAWPPIPSAPTPIYFREGGRLSFDPPPQNGTTDFDEYISDPMDPVPYVDRPVASLDSSYMARDQRFASKRRDVLVYMSDVLKRDLTIAGPITTNLFFTSSGTDSDVIVKLIDVHPDANASPANCTTEPTSGYQEMVRGDVIRAKFRNSFEHLEPMVPGEATLIAFAMPDAFHTFKVGHRIMVQIQSSWFPLVDRNPQSFVDIYHANPSDFKVVQERLYRTSRQSSALVLPVLRSNSVRPLKIRD